MKNMNQNTNQKVTYIVKVTKKLLESNQIIPVYRVDKFKDLKSAEAYFNFHMEHPAFDDGIVLNRVFIIKQVTSGDTLSERVIKKSPLNLL